MKRLKKRLCKRCYDERYKNPTGAKLVETSWKNGKTVCVIVAKDELANDGRTVLFFEHHKITNPPPEWCPYYLEQIL
jgi:hypothetical protein